MKPGLNVKGLVFPIEGANGYTHAIVRDEDAEGIRKMIQELM